MRKSSRCTSAPSQHMLMFKVIRVTHSAAALTVEAPSCQLFTGIRTGTRGVFLSMARLRLGAVWFSLDNQPISVLYVAQLQADGIVFDNSTALAR